MTIEEMLERKVMPVVDGCWLWTAGLDRHGYGQVSHDDKMRRAHRVVYEALVGPIPEGLEIHHHCRVRSCVNPSHLEPVTHAQNMRHLRTCDHDDVRVSGTKSYCHPCRMEYQRKYRASRKHPA